MNIPDAVIITKCAADHVEIILQREGRLLNCFQGPGLTSHFLSDSAMLIRPDVLWVELILCNSWQGMPCLDTGYGRSRLYWDNNEDNDVRFSQPLVKSWPPSTDQHLRTANIRPIGLSVLISNIEILSRSPISTSSEQERGDDPTVSQSGEWSL